LTLAQRLARAIGGDLALTGGVLRLTLEGATPPAIAAAPEQPLLGRRILVAEDNCDIRDATVWLLKRLGADARAARDGQEALELAARERFDVILMDVRMPRLDGLEATRRLRAQGVRTPIVALTADAVGEQPEECLAAGCTTHLSKPLDTERLIALVGKSR
jgi:CheY-like chemotaxis protein